MLWNYRVKTDKASGITNDPNAYSDDPRYIPDLVKRVTYVSVETAGIAAALPALSELTPPDGAMPPAWTAEAKAAQSANSQTTPF